MELPGGLLRGEMIYEGEGNAHAGPFLGQGGLGFTTMVGWDSANTRQWVLQDVSPARIRNPNQTGARWEHAVDPYEVAGMPAGGRGCAAFAVSRQSGDVMAQAHWRRLLITTTGPSGWAIAPGAPDLGDEDPNDKSSGDSRYFQQMRFDPSNDDVLYISQPKTAQGLSRYIRSTQTWTTLTNAPLDPGTVNILEPLPDQTSALSNGRHSRMYLVVGQDQIWASNDMGATQPAFANLNYPAANISNVMVDSTGRLLVCDSVEPNVYAYTAATGWQTIPINAGQGRPLRVLCQISTSPVQFFGRSGSQTADIYFPNADFSSPIVWPNTNTRNYRTGHIPATAVSSRDQVSVANMEYNEVEQKVYLCTGWGLLTIPKARIQSTPAAQTLIWDTMDNYGIETLVTYHATFITGSDGREMLFLGSGDRAIIKMPLPGEGRYGAKDVFPHRQGMGGRVSQALDNPDALYARIWAQIGPSGDIATKSTDFGESWIDKDGAPYELKGTRGSGIVGNEGNVIYGSYAGGWPEITFDDRQTFQDVQFYPTQADAIAGTNMHVQTGSFYFAGTTSSPEYIERDPDVPGRFFIYSWGGGGVPCGIYETIPGTPRAFLVKIGLMNAGGYISTIESRGYNDVLRYDPISKYLYHSPGDRGSLSLEDPNKALYRLNTLDWTVTSLTVPNEPYKIDLGAPFVEGEPMVLWTAGGWINGRSTVTMSRDCGVTTQNVGAAFGGEIPQAIGASKTIPGLICVGMKQSGYRIGRFMDVLA